MHLECSTEHLPQLFPLVVTLSIILERLVYLCFMSFWRLLTEASVPFPIVKSMEFLTSAFQKPWTIIVMVRFRSLKVYCVKSYEFCVWRLYIRSENWGLYNVISKLRTEVKIEIAASRRSSLAEVEVNIASDSKALCASVNCFWGSSTMPVAGSLLHLVLFSKAVVGEVLKP